MIDPKDAKIGMTVFYQRPGMSHPEYGVISNIGEYFRNDRIIHVRFMFDTTSKACIATDLYWPPNFCARDGANHPEQKYSEPSNAVGRFQ